jgi:hypothetical protein
MSLVVGLHMSTNGLAPLRYCYYILLKIVDVFYDERMAIPPGNKNPSKRT